jgi:hypothetical protein
VGEGDGGTRARRQSASEGGGGTRARRRRAAGAARVTTRRRPARKVEAQLPVEVRRQVTRLLRDAERTARATIKQLEGVLKRIDDLTKQARAASEGTTTKRAPSTRRPEQPSRTRSTSRGAAPRRRATRRRAVSPESVASHALDVASEALDVAYSEGDGGTR